MYYNIIQIGKLKYIHLYDLTNDPIQFIVNKIIRVRNS